MAIDPHATCLGCGHPMSDHLGPNGELIGIPVETPGADPATCFAGQTEQQRLWDLHDRGYMDDAEYAAALAEIEQSQPR
ncbi:MAG: hypothetical protein ABJA94_11045 [Rhodoglobus sp.]